MPKCCAIVDAYSTAKYLPIELKKQGIEAIHVQSMQEILEYDKDSFLKENFRDNIIYDDDLKSTVSSLISHGVEFVIAGSESGVNLADQISEQMNLPTNGSKLSQCRRDKFLMAQRLSSAQVRVPISFEVQSEPQLQEALERIGQRKFVLKPLHSAGSEDVFFGSTQKDAVKAFKQIHNRTNGMGLVNEKVLLQERVFGPQYIVNSVSNQGKHYVTEIWHDQRKILGDTRNLYEREVFIGLEGPTCETLKHFVGSALDALGIKYGPCHSEVIVDENGPVLIEVGTRMQGSIDYTAIESALGYSHVTVTIASYLGPKYIEELLYKSQPKAISCLSMISTQEGRIIEHQSIDAIYQLDSFYSIYGLKKQGEWLEKTVDLLTVPGVVYLVHQDPKVVEKDADSLRKLEQEVGFFKLER